MDVVLYRKKRTFKKGLEIRQIYTQQIKGLETTKKVYVEIQKLNIKLRKRLSLVLNILKLIKFK